MSAGTDGIVNRERFGSHTEDAAEAIVSAEWNDHRHCVFMLPKPIILLRLCNHRIRMKQSMYDYLFWFPTTQRPEAIVCIGTKETTELDGTTWRKR